MHLNILCWLKVVHFYISQICFKTTLKMDKCELLLSPLKTEILKPKTPTNTIADRIPFFRFVNAVSSFHYDFSNNLTMTKTCTRQRSLSLSSPSLFHSLSLNRSPSLSLYFSRSLSLSRTLAHSLTLFRSFTLRVYSSRTYTQSVAVDNR